MDAVNKMEIKQVSAEVICGDEFPYRVSIGGAHGTAGSPSGAVIAALSVGRLIPSGIRHDNEAVERYLERNYEDTQSRNILINIIKRNRII